MEKKEDFDSIAYPICPLNFFFEGDEDKCNQAECDFDLESRRCSLSCTTPEIRKEQIDRLLEQEANDRM